MTWYGSRNPKPRAYCCMSLRYCFERFPRMFVDCRAFLCGGCVVNFFAQVQVRRRKAASQGAPLSHQHIDNLCQSSHLNCLRQDGLCIFAFGSASREGQGLHKGQPLFVWKYTFNTFPNAPMRFSEASWKETVTPSCHLTSPKTILQSHQNRRRRRS